MSEDDSQSRPTALDALFDALESAAQRVAAPDGINQPIENYDKESVKAACLDVERFRRLPRSRLTAELKQFLHLIDPPKDLPESAISARSHGYDVLMLGVRVRHLLEELAHNDLTSSSAARGDTTADVGSWPSEAQSIRDELKTVRELMKKQVELLGKEAYQAGDESSEDPSVLWRVVRSGKWGVTSLNDVIDGMRAITALSKLASIALQEKLPSDFSGITSLFQNFVAAARWLGELMKTGLAKTYGLTQVGLLQMRTAIVSVAETLAEFIPTPAEEPPEQADDSNTTNRTTSRAENSRLRLTKRSLAIKLGTANTQIYVEGRGIQLDQPSIIAYRREGGRNIVIAAGLEAKTMLGNTPAYVEVIRPMRDGVIADFEVAEEMIRQFVRKVDKDLAFLSRRIIVTVPSGATNVERRAIHQSVLQAGARQVELIERPMAAAIGAGLPFEKPAGFMVIDVGGGTTEIAVISLGGIVYSRSLRVGGDQMDYAIVKYLRREHKILVGEKSAQLIKEKIGAAMLLRNDTGMALRLRGRSTLDGVPKEIEVTEAMVAEALREPVTEIIYAIELALEAMPPELKADIVDRGILLSGGGGLLRNFDIAIQDHLQLLVRIADEPMKCVVNGCGKVVENYSQMKSVLCPQP